ncbi:Protein-export membrane protein SecF [Rhodovulum sp. PH10]|uniref:protein translocase subunit SecF n=1 Tax=Rhodovulum sp. PH10 TaxID=1187851 RepID=UPI00027C28E1|nr:protein translocase subunit SecF [Rhodovulum sp. PH10]EJW12185.1 Protein-export membrane protein SecF [Rhodovulum sp. PH10]
MKLLRLVPDNTNLPFMKWRRVTFPLSAALSLLAVVLFFTVGLNFGIDFRGGTLMEVQSKSGPADLATLRSTLTALDLGEVQLQRFGADNDVLIRLAQQPGGDAAQQAAVAKVKGTLGDAYDYRRVEVVGPRVSGELVQSGILGMLVAIIGILIYLWFRFEWEFAVGATIATLHDVVLTIGFFSLLQLDFDLSSVAAVLTIMGYSVNDTVVIYDRIREMLRRYKRIPIEELLDLAMNTTLARTVITSTTVILSLLGLFFFGPEAIQSFVQAMLFGAVVGIYSSAFIAAPLLIYFGLRTQRGTDAAEDAATGNKKAAKAAAGGAAKPGTTPAGA